MSERTSKQIRSVFIEKWQAARTLRAVARRFHLTPRSATERAGEIRKSGFRLKYFGSKENHGGRPLSLKPINKTCPTCSKQFECRRAHEISNRKYCSRRCFLLAIPILNRRRRLPRLEHQCLNCSKPIAVASWQARTKRFCSYSCNSAYHSAGERNSSWAGGNGEYWKRKARERDHHTCRRCGVRPARRNGLHAHHLHPVMMGGEHSLEGIWSFCIPCHRKVERWFYSEIVKMVGPLRLKRLVEKLKSRVRRERRLLDAQSDHGK